jgi:aminopeptidase N
VPLSYWVPEDRRADSARTFGRTKEMLRCFAETFGVDYPWNKYAQVVVSDFIFGGMENTTATTLTEHVLIDERAALDIDSDDLIAHELAHQWFGDYVTCRDWSEGWLNEGFATFAEHLFRAERLGRDEFYFGLRTDLSSYLAEARGRYQRPIVCQEYDAPLDLFDRHLYEKGALALHVLRVTLGPEVFRQAVGAYLRAHAHGVVETRDLLRAMEARSGRSLGKLFDQLLYKPGHPRLSVTLRWDDGILFVATKQSQSGAQVPEAFEAPLELSLFHQGRGAKLDSESLVLQVAERTQNFAVPCPVRPLFVVVDEQMGILGEVTVKAPLDMLAAQARRADSARGRWLALGALAYEEDPRARTALSSALADADEFWGVRVVAAEALGTMGTPWALAVLCAHAQTSHPKVRRAVASALGEFRSAQAASALEPLALRDPSYMVCAAAARALGKTGQPGALPVLLEVVDHPSWADVIAAGALDGMAELRAEEAAPHVLARMSLGRPTRVRRAAATALPKLSTDRATRVALEQMLTDADPYLRIDVVRALVELGDLKCRGALQDRLARDLDPRVRRRIREALRELAEGDKKRDLAIDDRLHKLTEEIRTLRDRVLTLEARAPATPARAPAPVASPKVARPKPKTPKPKPKPRK